MRGAEGQGMRVLGGRARWLGKSWLEGRGRRVAVGGGDSEEQVQGLRQTRPLRAGSCPGARPGQSSHKGNPRVGGRSRSVG